MCPGNNRWNWCRINLDEIHTQKINVEFLYELPNDVEELGPINDLYYMDKQYQTIWYIAGIYDIFYVNYTEGNVIYKLLDTLHDSQLNRNVDCIAHDYSLNRTFSLVYPGTTETHYLLAELHPAPQNETILMKLPANLRISLIGTCAYCTKTHTLILSH